MSSSLCTTLARPNRSGERRNVGGGGRTRIHNGLVFSGFARDADAGSRRADSTMSLLLQREVHGETEQKWRTKEPGEGGSPVCSLHGNTTSCLDMNEQWCSGALRSGHTPFYKQPIQQRINKRPVFINIDM